MKLKFSVKGINTYDIEDWASCIDLPNYSVALLTAIDTTYQTNDKLQSTEVTIPGKQ